MGKEYKSKYIILIILLCPFIVSSCYSYREISKADYLKNEKHSKTKIILNNKKELILDESDSTKIIADNEKIVIINDNKNKYIFFRY